MADSTAARQKMRLQLVVLSLMLSLQTSHVCQIEKKQLQSIPINISRGLSEKLCIGNSGT